jgi:hypothetical protein
MNKDQLKELVKKYFSLTEMTETENSSEENQNFDSATLVDGTKITNKKDSSFAVGDELYVITEAGEEVLAPSGEHSTESGITVTVDGEGKITGIARPDGDDSGSLAEHEEEMKDLDKGPAKVLQTEATELSEESTKEVKLEEDEIDMDMHPEEEAMDIKEEIIEAIMTEVGPAIEELRKKMTEHEDMLTEHEEKMTEYMSAPSSKPTAESRYAKSRNNFEKPKAVYNQKRYEKALFKLTNSKNQ